MTIPKLAEPPLRAQNKLLFWLALALITFPLPRTTCCHISDQFKRQNQSNDQYLKVLDVVCGKTKFSGNVKKTACNNLERVIFA